MARIWDCDPRYLNGQHLVAEHQELGILICDMLKPAHGRRGRFSHHHEAKRFAGRYDLLILRSDFLSREALGRGYEFSQRWICIEEDLFTVETGRVYCLEDHSWEEWVRLLDWPKSYEGVYWTPWRRDKMTQADYFRLGKSWSRD